MTGQIERFATMDGDERAYMLERNIDGAKERFKAATGQPWDYYFVEVVAYCAEWLMLNEADLTSEFMQALIAEHARDHRKKSYKAATVRLKVAKAALHARLVENSEARDRSRLAERKPVEDGRVNR